MTTISAVIPVFGPSPNLGRALDALLSQTRPLHEVLLWEDGLGASGEDLAQMAEARSAGSPVMVRHAMSPAPAGIEALDLAIAASLGEAIWTCDADDIARPEAAALLAGRMEETGAPVVAGRYIDETPSADAPASPMTHWPDLSEGTVLRHLLEDMFLFLNATLVTRSTYDRIGPFSTDPGIAVDYEMLLRLATRAPVSIIDQALFVARPEVEISHASDRQRQKREADSIAHWQESDQALLHQFRAVLPVSLYTALFEAEDGELCRRAGLLQRAAIHTRRDMWPEAMDDLEAAAAITRPGPLNGVEWAICQRAMAGRGEGIAVHDLEIRRRLGRLRYGGGVAADIAAALARGARLKVAQRGADIDPNTARRVHGFCLALAGSRGLKDPDETPPRHLLERSILPADSYDW